MADYSEDQKRELRRRLKILREQLEAGRVHFAPLLFEETKKSLMAVRNGADGEIDLDTVDGRVRSMALAVAAMHDRDKVKHEISLADIQHTYFRWLEENFGPSWLVIGDVEVAAAVTGMPLYGLAALASNQLLEVPKRKDFPGKVRECN
jgi:hypothetical protein